MKLSNKIIYIERLGDILAVLIPIFVLLRSESNKIKIDFKLKFLLGQTLVLILKFITNIKRPNGEDNLSFPSGHMYSASFPSFYHAKNIGYNNIIFYILLLLSIFTGASRIISNNHRFVDVLVSFILSYIFTHLML